MFIVNLKDQPLETIKAILRYEKSGRRNWETNKKAAYGRNRYYREKNKIIELKKGGEK